MGVTQMKICTLIITHNRADKLKNLLEELNNQTYKEFDTVVFDANSTDSTLKVLKDASNEHLNIIHSDIDNRDQANCAAIKTVYEQGYDWIWVLHDDVVPNDDALENLVEATHNVNVASFFASTIVTKNDRLSYVPDISLYSSNGMPAWGEKLEFALVRIGKASFASVLINRQAIEKCGVPDDEATFGDNSSYLKYLIKNFGAAYLVGKSKVIHLKKINSPKRIAPPPPIKVCAVVVTYNRKAMLETCINSLLKQSYKNFDILIIDNASTDGTYDYICKYLSDRIHYFNTGANLGGSGGFYYGMKKAYEVGYDWLWIMDDDVMPTDNALAELINHLNKVKTVSFLASAVYSKDNKAMNTPEISRYSTNGYKFWYDKLEYGMVRLAHATFVSLLINRQAIKKCGLPCKDYFIWGDDIEYTMRLIGKFGAAYMVGSSKVYHLRSSSSALSIFTEKDPNRLKMYYYMIRNTLLNTKTYFGKVAYKNAFKRYYKDCIKLLFMKNNYRRIKIKTILRAITDFKNKKYDVKAFNNRYNFYGQETAVLNFVGNNFVANDIRNVNGYTVKTEIKDFSPLTVLNDIPFAFKELGAQRFDEEIIKCLNKSNLNSLKSMSKDEYLVVDFADMLLPLLALKVNNHEVYSVLSCELKEQIANEVEYEYYEKMIISPLTLNDETIGKCLQKFALEITKYCLQNHILLIKRIGVNDKESEVFLNKIYQTFEKLLPQIRIVSTDWDNKSQEITSQIKSMFANRN